MDGRIFVSYARADADFALRLANDLRAANVPVWIDEADIRPGEEWDRAVADALRACTAVLVVLSPRAVSSRSVMDEVSFALDEDRTVFPVVYEECDVPFRLRRLQHADFRQDYSSGLAAIVRALGGGQMTDRGAPSTRDTPGHPRRLSVRAALLMGTAGGTFTTIAQLLIFANDPRMGTDASHGHSLLWWVLLPALGTVVPWSLAGIVTAGQRVPLISAVMGAGLVLGAWIAIYGTYNDVMMTAVVAGSPVGAIVGAAVGRSIRNTLRARELNSRR